MANFEMTAGDNETLGITIRDRSGALVDLTGATAQFALHKTGRVNSLISKNSLDGLSIAGSVVTVPLLPGDTIGLSGLHHYELQVMDAVGHTSTAIQEWCIIKSDLVPSYNPGRAGDETTIAINGVIGQFDIHSGEPIGFLLMLTHA